MQLFLLSSLSIKGTDITIDDADLRQQAKKVLRLEVGDAIFVQEKKVRYEVEVSAMRDQKIFGKIKNTLKAPEEQKPVSLIIAMPNKREKAELIVQKLTEIGISEIIFRPSERSVIKSRNDNKAGRLEKIMKEALEQSRGWQLPTVTFASDIHEYLENNRLIVFDVGGKLKIEDGKLFSGNPQSSTFHLQSPSIIGIVGPEGGFSPKDYKTFGEDREIMSLGATVLRMETAAIVGAWLLKNGL